MAAGEFSKEFDVDVKNSNSDPEKDRVLFLNLTSVTGSKNPLFVKVVTCSFYFETQAFLSHITFGQNIFTLARIMQVRT